jgi:hypothetical protein
MIEKTPIVRQISQIAKCAAIWTSHAISGKHQCRGAASSLGRTRHHCPFGVTSLIPFFNNRATWSEVNLNPCPSGMRSAETGYLGRGGSDAPDLEQFAPRAELAAVIGG